MYAFYPLHFRIKRRNAYLFSDFEFEYQRQELFNDCKVIETFPHYLHD